MISDVELKRIVLDLIKSDSSDYTISDLVQDGYGDQVFNILKDLKRDVENQFIASKARVYDMQALCATASATGELVPVKVDKTYNGRVVEVMDYKEPGVALSMTMARESRWKVKNNKFLSAIETKISDIRYHMDMSAGAD